MYLDDYVILNEELRVRNNFYKESKIVLNENRKERRKEVFCILVLVFCIYFVL